ncbi:hypothetical protein [Micromonospora sp. CMU55-4]|uniref:hypothetical protein n=1 Tax=Micromonospora sp. CMU55-4 TaxID=2717028 RepID=UPI00140D1200|nr:hypothetical protein [Micromonospora sp. CMU55-4]NHO85137.1 hypothetical protein [Micromonospora sp. CMU55-4]
MVRDRPDDLNEAIEQYQEAVAAVSGAPVPRAALQSNLAHALSRWYMLTGSAADLTAAISVGREALESAGSRPVPDRAASKRRCWRCQAATGSTSMAALKPDSHFPRRCPLGGGSCSTRTPGRPAGDADKATRPMFRWSAT